jgi:hypothetical protein
MDPSLIEKFLDKFSRRGLVDAANRYFTLCQTDQPRQGRLKSVIALGQGTLITRFIPGDSYRRRHIDLECQIFWRNYREPMFFDDWIDIFDICFREPRWIEDKSLIVDRFTQFLKICRDLFCDPQDLENALNQRLHQCGLLVGKMISGIRPRTFWGIILGVKIYVDQYDQWLLLLLILGHRLRNDNDFYDHVLFQNMNKTWCIMDNISAIRTTALPAFIRRVDAFNANLYSLLRQRF